MTLYKRLTVDGLRELLAATDIPGDLIVAAEGCDCVGDAIGVEVLEADKHNPHPRLLVVRFGNYALDNGELFDRLDIDEPDNGCPVTISALPTTLRVPKGVAR